MWCRRQDWLPETLLFSVKCPRYLCTTGFSNTSHVRLLLWGHLLLQLEAGPSIPTIFWPVNSKWVSRFSSRKAHLNPLIHLPPLGSHNFSEHIHPPSSSWTGWLAAYCIQILRETSGICYWRNLCSQSDGSQWQCLEAVWYFMVCKICLQTLFHFESHMGWPHLVTQSRCYLRYKRFDHFLHEKKELREVKELAWEDKDFRRQRDNNPCSFHFAIWLLATSWLSCAHWRELKQGLWHPSWLHTSLGNSCIFTFST